MGKLFSRCIFIVLVLAMAACRHETPATAKLILGFGGKAGSAKAFVPGDMSISSINIEALGPGGAKVLANSIDCSPVELDLAPGSWMITAKGLSAAGAEVASGFLELSLGPSEAKPRS